jgi:hypothetical protein
MNRTVFRVFRVFRGCSSTPYLRALLPLAHLPGGVSATKFRAAKVIMNSVDRLDDELSELKAFIEELKADRAAQKEKERREAWTRYTSLSLVFIAVLAAIATQWAGKYSSRVLVSLNGSTFFQISPPYLPTSGGGFLLGPAQNASFSLSDRP